MRGSGTTVDRPPEVTPVGAVVWTIDAALRSVSSRSLVLRTEAQRILEGVLDDVPDARVRASMVPVIDRAVASFTGELVDSGRIVDALLDLRSCSAEGAPQAALTP